MAGNTAHYPNLHGASNGVVNSAQQTMDNIKNSQTVQSIANGPVADKARTEVNATKNEFGNLAAARQTPSTTTANGQDLTHYHSLFYSLLSWENPRATTVSYVTIALSILIFRYMPLARYVLRMLYLLLGATAVAEITGKVALGEGFASKMRPKRYFTISHDTLQSILNDVEELLNFFVIEFQRIVFAENVFVTTGAFVTAFITYFLVKLMPTWGLALFFTTLVYFTPLAYIMNKELIDEHINNAQNIVTEQTNQVRNLAAHHTNNAVQASQSAFKDYSRQAQEIIGSAKKSTVDKGAVSPATADKVTPAVNSQSFPTAPSTEPSTSGGLLGETTAPSIDEQKTPIAA